MLLVQQKPKSLESIGLMQFIEGFESAMDRAIWAWLALAGMPLLAWIIAFARDSEAHLIKTSLALGLVGSLLSVAISGGPWELLEWLPGPAWPRTLGFGCLYGTAVGLAPAILIRVLRLLSIRSAAHS